MGQKILLFFTLAVALTALALVLFNTQNTDPKYGYVRFEEVFMKYEGKMEASKAYENKAANLKSNLDTLNADLQAAISEFNLRRDEMSPEKQQEKFSALRRQEEQLAKYAQVIEGQIYKEDQKLSEGVVKQMNSFIQEYGKNQGYLLILGTKPTTGTVMYGDDAVDITNEVIAYLNAKYRGEQ